MDFEEINYISLMVVLMMVDKMPIMYLILYSIPESFLIFIFGYVLIGKPINRKYVLIATIISVILAYGIRQLTIPLGFHTIIGVIFIILIFILVCKFTLKQSVFVSLAIFCTLIVIESFCLYLIQVAFALDIFDIIKMPPLLRAFVGWPQLALDALLIYTLHKKNISLGGFLANDKRSFL